MARSRGFVRSSRKGHLEWTPFSGNIQAVSAGTSIAVALINGAPGTIMRTRGSVLAHIDSPTDGDSAAIHWGLCVASDDLVTAGAAAFPDPGLDASNQFYVYGTLVLDAQAANNGESVVARADFDSKAMRKFQSAEQCVIVVQNVQLAGTPVVDFTIAGRSLASS